MGLDNIKDIFLRKEWEKIIQLTKEKLLDKDIQIKISQIKSDGTHVKFTTNFTSVRVAFARDRVGPRRWVELELKGKSSKNGIYPQNELYSFLRKNFKCQSILGNHSITWNEDDLRTSPRRENGNDIRIKIYMKNQDINNWVDGFIKFAECFLPLLQEYKIIA